jgi:hypothetical protein
MDVLYRDLAKNGGDVVPVVADSGEILYSDQTNRNCVLRTNAARAVAIALMVFF